MSLNDTSCSVKYTGDGTTVNFPFYFDAIDAGWIAVYEDGVAVSSTLYSVTLTSTGGRVQFATAPASGTVIVISRNVPFSQLTTYPNFSAISAENIEKSYDKLTAIGQQLRDDLTLCVKVNPGEDPEEYWLFIKTQMDISVSNCLNAAGSTAADAIAAQTAAETAASAKNAAQAAAAVACAYEHNTIDLQIGPRLANENDNTLIAYGTRNAND